MTSSKFLVLISALGFIASITVAQTNIIGDYTTTKGPDFIGGSSALGNGDFSLESGAQTFSGVSNWFNLAGDETVNLQVTNGTNGSPQSGSTAAQLSGTTFLANSTGFTITKADQQFNFSAYLGQFGSKALYATDTTVTATLFTTGSGVNATTGTGDITVIGTIDFTPFSSTTSFFNMVTGTIATSTADDVGKTVYLGVNLTDTDNNAFPRFDVASLSVTDLSAVPEPSSFALLAGLGSMAFMGGRRRRR
ncbi:MAG: hypothetical protein SynsKO_21310 [Synoicihabitans sp.]